MTMSDSFRLAIGTLAVVIAGTASAGDNTAGADRLAFYRAQAGEPVSSFRFNGNMRGWNALGDNALTVQTSQKDQWLIELESTCQNLQNATHIGLSSRANRVTAKFDKVIVTDDRMGVAPQVTCSIASIRPLDPEALREHPGSPAQVDSQAP